MIKGGGKNNETQDSVQECHIYAKDCSKTRIFGLAIDIWNNLMYIGLLVFQLPDAASLAALNDFMNTFQYLLH